MLYKTISTILWWNRPWNVYHLIEFLKCVLFPTKFCRNKLGNLWSEFRLSLFEQQTFSCRFLTCCDTISITSAAKFLKLEYTCVHSPWIMKSHPTLWAHLILHILNFLLWNVIKRFTWFLFLFPNFFIITFTYLKLFYTNINFQKPCYLNNFALPNI